MFMDSPAAFSVRVERNRLKFAAAHMATFGGGCEPLHGHNYAVGLTVAGDLGDDAWVIDFGTLKRIGRQVCDSMDHRVLLQMESRAGLSVERTDGAYDVRFGDRCYRLPASDVFELPADNSTAERIAECIWEHVRHEFAGLPGASSLRHLAVEVEEAPGQSATYAADVSYV